MTVEQAIKKYDLDSVDPITASKKCKELNVEKIIYMKILPNKEAFIVVNGLGTWLYTKEKSFISKSYKNMKQQKLND